MFIGTLQCALLIAGLSPISGTGWRWPQDAESAESVRIDAKVGFVDDQENNKRINRGNVQADEPTFHQPTDTEGFYNRPPGSGRYPVRVEQHRDDRNIRINGRPANYDGGRRNQNYQDGTLDSLQHCKCVSTPDCEVRTDYANACGANQYLCCYNVPGKQNGLHSEFFNEVEDERPMLFPSQPNQAGPFSSSNFDNVIFGQNQPAILVGPGGPTGMIGPQRKPVLIGPEGPTGVIGPGSHNGVGTNPGRPVLVGPGGPTGVIGPGSPTGVGTNPERPVLVGPGGPTGVIGPDNDKPYLVGPSGPTGAVGPDRPVLVGPSGPTGIIGPANDDRNDNLLVRPLGHPNDIRQSESAQRGVLVGPGGPTGIIGPAFNQRVVFPGFNQPVLVGPGGPTGIIGPRLVGPGGPTGIIGPNFNRQRGSGILVGPGGPTGIIGPGRPLLVGPGGPTGRIGPRNFFGK